MPPCFFGVFSEVSIAAFEIIQRCALPFGREVRYNVMDE